jgi:hypothetical protein
MDAELVAASQADETYQSLIAALGRYEGLLAGEQKDRLRTARLSAESSDYLDYQMSERTPVDLNDRQIASTIDVLVPLIENTDNGLDGDLEDATAILISSFSVLEIPLSYAVAPTEQLSLGVTIKALVARVDALELTLTGIDGDDIYSVQTGTTADFAWGLDLGLMWHWSHGAIGLRARNVNAPSFSGIPVQTSGVAERYQVDPEVTLGIAWMPSRWFVVAADLDLLPTRSLFRGNDLGIPEVYLQYARLGVEIPLWAIDLRAGVYRNIASGDQPNIYSFGLGFDARKAYFDLAIATSLEDTATYDGYDIPEALRVGLGIGFGF